MVEILERCLSKAEVFSRDVANKSLFETNSKRDRNGSLWAIIAAGISDQDAERYFKPGSDRAGHAKTPLQIAGGGQTSILLQMRPIEWPSSQPEAARFVAYYAPDEAIPFIEILKGEISVDLFDNDLGLFNLRWEVDPARSGRPPLEPWLREWRQILGFNPAHPPSHLHFNSRPRGSPADRSHASAEPAENELRLAAGNPNPLAFLLSITAWLRRILKCY